MTWIRRRTRAVAIQLEPVIVDVTPLRVPPAEEISSGFWLHSRGAVVTTLWNVQRAHGRRYYARHTAHRPPLQLSRERQAALRDAAHR